jgi:hypothetical protein
MDELRIRVFTLFATLTSIAAGLVFWAPTVFVLVLKWPIRLSALVQLTSILIMVPLMFQNRVYHKWMFSAIAVAMNLEKIIYAGMGPAQAKKYPQDQLLLTHGLTRLKDAPVGYWRTMWKSELFWNEVLMFAILIIAAIVLFWAFQTGVN